MKKIIFYIAGFVMTARVLLPGCAAPVQVEKDKQTDFSRYKTFAWMNGNNGKKSNANELEDKNVHDAVSRELQNSTWKEVFKDPDVLISAENTVSEAFYKLFQ